MVVNSRFWIALVSLLFCGFAAAQQPSLRAWVDKTNIKVDQPFWLFVKASGSNVGTPEIPQVEGLIINVRSPQISRQMVMSRGRTSMSIRLAFSTTAIRAGEIMIPPVSVMIDGTVMETDPIILTVGGTPIHTPQSRAKVRLWADSEIITKGVPFWIYIEASGGEVILPEELHIDGLSIDNVNIRRSSSSVAGGSSTIITRQHAFHVTAAQPGTITIPAIKIVVDGQTIITNPVRLTVSATPPKQTVDVNTPSNQEELTKDDLLFINMEVDKEEVYQGEAIALKTELWRIIHRQIQSGPYRGSLLIPPSTEGFYVTILDPVSRTQKRGGLDYEVSEERKVLYPMALGDLHIGQWHWEGVALFYRHNISRRQRLRYSLNAGPIKIHVKSLPKRPEGFSGAVGQFTVTARLNDQALTQGVPTTLVLTVEGEGNPGAIGDPVMPELDWAHLPEPKRKVEAFISKQTELPTVKKQFTYEITPLKQGAFTIPRVNFIYFDPLTETYQTASVGPYEVTVDAGDFVQQHLVVSSDANQAHAGVEVLAEDIRPIIGQTNSLKAYHPLRGLLPGVALLPVLGYAGIVAVAMRRRRFSTDIGFARAYRAKSNAANALKHIRSAEVPVEALSRATLAYIADSFNIDCVGMTSEDVRVLLMEQGIGMEIVERGTRILRACERTTYASQTLSDDELGALLEGAQAFIADLEGAKA